MTKIIGLDISPASTGVAIGDATAPPRTFSVGFTALTHGDMWWKYLMWLRDLLILEKPDVVAYEAAPMWVGKQGSADTARILLGFDAHTQSLCAGRGVDARSVRVQTWRKAFLAEGTPNEPKQASLAMCAQLGWDTGGVHDRAEACGVWVWGHYYHGNQRAMSALLSSMKAQPLARGE